MDGPRFIIYMLAIRCPLSIYCQSVGSSLVSSLAHRNLSGVPYLPRGQRLMSPPRARLTAFVVALLTAHDL